MCNSWYRHIILPCIHPPLKHLLINRQKGKVAFSIFFLCAQLRFINATCKSVHFDSTGTTSRELCLYYIHQLFFSPWMGWPGWYSRRWKEGGGSQISGPDQSIFVRPKKHSTPARQHISARQMWANQYSMSASMHKSGRLIPHLWAVGGFGTCEMSAAAYAPTKAGFLHDRKLSYCRIL